MVFSLDHTFNQIFVSQASPGIIANPFATGIVRKNSLESISSIDRELSPEEMEIIQKVQNNSPPDTIIISDKTGITGVNSTYRVIVRL